MAGEGRFSTKAKKSRNLLNRWRRGSESNDVFTDNQPQYPDFQGYFSADFIGVQAPFTTTHHLPDLTRHVHCYYSVIEEIVEGFVEGFLTNSKPFSPMSAPDPVRLKPTNSAPVLLQYQMVYSIRK